MGTFAAWARARPVCVAERPPAGEWSGIWSAVRLFCRRLDCGERVRPYHGLATLAIFWWTVTGWMNSLRHAVRAMFDDCGDELNIVVARLRDTLAAIAIAILFILSTAAGTVSGGIVRRLLQWGGIPSSSLPGTVLLEMTGFGTGVALNFALFMLLLRVVSHIKAGRFTILGALLGSLTVSAMQLLGARLLAGASRNPMLAPFAALIGVLIWFNLVAQVILLCAALIAECRQKS